MAQAIKTVLTYNLDGATKDFNIPFEYLARKFVVVTLIGVDRKTLILNQDYRFATRTTISTTLAWGPATGYNQIEIRRYTSATERLVDFTDGSILRAYDLNVAQVQTLHVAEEARDLTADTIGVNNDGNLDARGRRIVNLADAVLDSDAISFGQVKRMNENSWQARNEALQFRNEAETFRNQAEGFKNESGTNAANTKQWRDDAKGFRDEAEQFKNTAGQYATSAGTSASAAHQSEVNAGNSATASANSAHLAEQQADRAEREANKLGNWNDLAGAVESVSGTMVTWAGHARYTDGVSIQRSDNKSRLYRQGFWGDGNQLNTDFVLHFEDGTARALMQFTYNKSNPLNANIRLQDNVNITNTLTVGSTSDMNGRVTINAPDMALRLNGVAGKPNYIQGLRDGASEWMVGTDHNNSQTFYSLQFNHGLYLMDGKVSIGKPLHVASAIFTTNGDSFGTAWDNGWLSSYLGRFIVDIWQAADTWTARSGGYNNVYCPAGNYMSGGGGTGAGFDGIFSRPMWVRFHNGTTRIIAKK